MPRDKDELYEVDISPDEAKKLYEKSKEDGSSVRLAIQLNENHHYYPEENDTLFPVGEVDHLHNLDPKYVDKFFEILKSEQDASIQNTKDTHRLEFYGLLGGVGLCIALMLCGIYALSIDESWIAGIIFGTTIVAISTILFLKKEWKHKPPNTTDDEKL